MSYELTNADGSVVDTSADPIHYDEREQAWRIGNVLYADTGRIMRVTRPLADAQAARTAECDRLAKAKRDAVVANISAAEMASWPIKRAEAKAYQAAGAAATDADAPNLAIEATARGITTATLVTKVLAKSAMLSQLEAGIAGINGKHNDAIASLTTSDAVEAYDITAGWPV